MSSDYTLDQNGASSNSHNDASHFNGLLNGSIPSANQNLAGTSSGTRVNLLVSSSSSNTSSVPSSPKHSAQNSRIVGGKYVPIICITKFKRTMSKSSIFLNILPSKKHLFVLFSNLVSCCMKV
jgi:hypothetical protein